MDARAPFPFIVGCPRSGTTLLRLMLNAHPELAIPPESYFPVEMRPWIGRYQRNGGFALGLFAEDLATSRHFPQVRRNWELDPSLIRSRLTGVHEIDYAEALRRLYALYAEVHGKTRYGDKTPWFVLHLRYLGQLFPEARFIHIIRDVRDVAPSLQAMEWGPDRLIHAAARWRQMVRAGRRAGRRLGAPRYLEVRYEQLVADPAGTLREVCDFLVLAYRDEMLKYHEHALEAIPAHARGLSENLIRPPIVGLRDWRRDLDPSSVLTCEAVATPLLRKLGYPVSEYRRSLRLRATVTAQVSWWSATRHGQRIPLWWGRNRFKATHRFREFRKRLLRAVRRRISRMS